MTDRQRVCWYCNRLVCLRIEEIYVLESNIGLCHKACHAAAQERDTA